MGSEKVVFLVIFIHPFENSGGYFFRGRLFWWILDINVQNFVRGYAATPGHPEVFCPHLQDKKLLLHVYPMKVARTTSKVNSGKGLI